MCSCIGDPSSRLYDPDRVFRCDFDVARVGGGGEGEIITRLGVCTLLSPKFGLHSVAKLIPVHKYTILVTVHGVTATPQTCEHSRLHARMYSDDDMKQPLLISNSCSLYTFTSVKFTHMLLMLDLRRSPDCRLLHSCRLQTYSCCRLVRWSNTPDCTV